MRSNLLVRLGSLAIAAILVVIGCESTKEDGAPVSFQDVVWQDAPVYVPADGLSQVELTVTVLTEDGKRVRNVGLTFTATLGTLTQEFVRTDQNGQAITYLISIASTTDQTSIVDAAITDTTGYYINPKTGVSMQLDRAPPGSVAIVSDHTLTDEELEARLHAILLERARENAQERRRGLGAVLGAPGQGQGAGSGQASADELTVIFEGVTIELTSDTSQLTADGVSIAGITVRARTVTRRVNLADRDITFTAVEGRITAGATTDQFGVANAILTSAITSAAVDTVHAYLGPSLSVTLIQSYVQPVLTVQADDTSLPADGTTTTAVRARLLSPAGKPVVGAQISFTLSGLGDASITPTGNGLTNVNGEAIAILKAGQSAGTATVTATFNALTDNVDVDVQDLVLDVTATPTAILANGQSQSTISVLVTESGTNSAVVGASVQFSTTLGSIIPTATTDESGVASVNLTAGTTTGTATVTATLGTRSNTTTVDMLPLDLNISLETSSPTGSILRDGDDTVELTVNVLDPNGDPLNNIRVTWITTVGTIFPATGFTGAGANNPGTHLTVLRADAGAADATATVTVTVADSTDALPIIFRGITITAAGVQPDEILANEDPSNIAVMQWRVTETTTGNLVANHPILISKISGPDVIFSSIATVTDGSGLAEAVISPTAQAGSLVMDAAIGAISTQQTLTLLQDGLSVSLRASPTFLLRDGIEQTMLIATVTDTLGDPVEGKRIDFTLTGDGILPRDFAFTDQSGSAEVTLNTDIDTTNSNAQIIASATHGATTSTDTLDVPLYAVNMGITSDDASIVADGMSSTKVHVTVIAGNGNPLEGRLVTFAIEPSPEGIINAQATTNGQGIAEATVMANIDVDSTATVTARLGDDPATPLMVQTTIDLIAPVVEVFFPAAQNPDPLMRNNTDSATLTVQVMGNGMPLAGETVNWSLTAAPADVRLSATASVTDGSGFATVTLWTDSGTTDDVATVEAEARGVTDNLSVTLHGIQLGFIRVEPDTLVANGNDTSVLTVQLQRGETSGSVVPDETIDFVTDLGSIQGDAITDSDGEANVTLTAGTATGTASVVAIYGGITDTTQVVLNASTPASISLDADPTALQVQGVGGTEQSLITAAVRDAFGNTVIAGTQVQFDVSPDGTFSNGGTTITRLTNSDGVAVATYSSSTTSGTKTFTATAGSANASYQLLTVASGPPDNIVYGHQDSTVTDLSNNWYQVDVGVIVKDQYHNEVEAGTVVYFTLVGANADTALITQAEVTTDENGVATTQLIYSADAVGLSITIRATSGTVTEDQTITLLAKQ